MMVDKVIDEKCLVAIQSLLKTKSLRDPVRTEDREKMRAMDNGIYTDDFIEELPIAMRLILFKMHCPHASIFIWGVVVTDKPIDKST